VAGDDDAAVVDQNRHQKAERNDTVRDLTDLLLRMYPRVARIGFERVNCDPLYSNHESFH
jgi:hypothetical protein